MSLIIPIIVRLAALFGVGLSPFLAGTILSVVSVAGLGIAFLGASHAGYARAAQVCEGKALQAKLAALEIEKKSLADRVGRSDLRASLLAQSLADTENQNRALAEELAKRPLQSTAQGAKRDPSALLDDRCGITDAGARRLR